MSVKVTEEVITCPTSVKFVPYVWLESTLLFFF